MHGEGKACTRMLPLPDLWEAAPPVPAQSMCLLLENQIPILCVRSIIGCPENLEKWGGVGEKEARTWGGGGAVACRTQHCENTEISKHLGPVQ